MRLLAVCRNVKRAVGTVGGNSEVYGREEQGVPAGNVLFIIRAEVTVDHRFLVMHDVNYIIIHSATAFSYDPAAM